MSYEYADIRCLFPFAWNYTVFLLFQFKISFKTKKKTNKKLENKSCKILLLFKNEKEENPAYEWAAENPFCWQITQQPK